MGDTGGRLNLPFPELTDPADVPADMSELAFAIEGNGPALYGQGLLASRPQSSASVPGKQGRFYYATDTGKVYYDHGFGWVEISGTHAGTHHPITGGDKLVMGWSGTRDVRPDAATVAEGLHYYATDQVVEFVAFGGTWHRLSLPAGSVVDWFKSTVPAGWVKYNGDILPASDGIYQDLYAHLGNSLQLPDTRGRMTVGQGTNTDVDNIGDNDGLGSVAARGPRHGHDSSSLRVSGRTLSDYQDPYYADYQGGAPGTVAGGGQGGWVSRIMGVVSTAAAGSMPMNFPAYITCVKIAKL